MGEAETCVQCTIISGCKHEGATRRNKRRRSKTTVRNDEETVGRAPKTAVVLVSTHFPSESAGLPLQFGENVHVAIEARGATGQVLADSRILFGRAFCHSY